MICLLAALLSKTTDAASTARERTIMAAAQRLVSISLTFSGHIDVKRWVLERTAELTAKLCRESSPSMSSILQI